MPPSAPTVRATGAALEKPLHALLDERSVTSPDTLAFRHLTEGESIEETLNYASLANRARNTAASLTARGLRGKPVLVNHPPGHRFIESLFACWYAGAIAVPAYPPIGKRHRLRLNAILTDTGAKHALAPQFPSPPDGIEIISGEPETQPPAPEDAPAVTFPGPCLLQYTSGSTASPKGVMISHHNFRNHFAALDCYRELNLRSALSWLPPYHDMGLVLKILYAFEAGIPLTFFSPELFVQRPVRWLRAISTYRAELSGAPNFAFETCLRSIHDDELEGIDLSCWKAAPCGAERIRPETLQRFADRFARCGFNPNAFRPGYGLAETTLTVTAIQDNASPPISTNSPAGRLISCGTPLPGTTLRIADPRSGKDLKPGEIGEIRIKSPIIAQGYWKRPDATRDTFGPDSDPELRTGDLGYLENNHLFVTSRIKDLVILDGVNHAPEDIESAAISAVPEITAAAAFAVTPNGKEMVTLALEAAELPKEQRADLCRRARRAVADTHEIPVHRTVLVRAGLLPRTTSGKIQRFACRDALDDASLKLLHDDHSTAPARPPDSNTLALVLDSISQTTGRAEPRPEDNAATFGMSSLDASRLASRLRARTRANVSIGDVFSAQNFASLAAAITNMPTITGGMPDVLPGSEQSGNLLTHSQERMWFLHQLDPRSSAYHVFGALELTGILSIPNLRRAFHAVVSRHEILRSRHGSENGRPKVTITHDTLPPLELHEAADEDRLQVILSRIAKHPFKLAGDSPVRASLIACGSDRHILAVCSHHIVIDGWSMRVLAKEIASNYALLQAGKEPTSLEQSVSYLDYAASHRGWIDDGGVDSQIEYWKERLSGVTSTLPLPVDMPRPHRPSSDGKTVEGRIPADLCNRIDAVARSYRATPFMIHLAAFLLLLKQHCSGVDPVVAIPVANRNHNATEKLIGTLVNTLPFHMKLMSGESFGTLLERVRESSLGMQENQDAPFERIIDAVKADRNNQHSPLAQVMIDHQEIPITESWDEHLSCRPYITHRGAAQFDLSLLLTTFNGHQQLAVEYRTDLFLEETATAILARHLSNIRNLCENPEAPVGSLTGLTEHDRIWLQTVSNGPERNHFLNRDTLSLITHRAGLHPVRTAVVSEGRKLDYQELMRRADGLATALRNQGVKPGDRIATMLERDNDLPVSLLAIWKAGAAYVPLDRANPPERLRHVLADQKPLHILVSAGLGDHIPTEFPVIQLQENLLETTPTDKLPGITPEDTAYVIYTSGSTGKPKGVSISHASLANFLLSMAETPGFTEADHLLAITTVSFDISTLEIFLPLIMGGSLELVSTAIARDGNALRERLESSKPTVMQATPATWRMLLNTGWTGSPDLKILCGGEAMDLALARALAPAGCQLWNLYGPTETSVWSSFWRVPRNPTSIRIGTPIANTGMHVVSKDGSVLPPAVPGDLWISGRGLADGYWKKTELTKSRFAPLTTPDGHTARAYQTGDIARWHRDGTLEYLGRSDDQVKIRGFRIELGEINEVLASHPDVTRAKTALRGTPESPKILAWAVPRPDAVPPELQNLRDFLAARLPSYMIPSDIGFIDSFPLNSNGKIDVSTLDAPMTTPRSETPATPCEQQLIDIWSELLDNKSIHPDDNWFHVGGHSLLALRLFARIHQDLHCNLPLSAILEHPTPRLLSALITKSHPTV